MIYLHRVSFSNNHLPSYGPLMHAPYWRQSEALTFGATLVYFFQDYSDRLSPRKRLTTQLFFGLVNLIVVT